MPGRLFIILIFICCIFQSKAQKLIFKTYSVNDGLIANLVRKIFQDSKGFIWICTWEGLSKYDGDKFTNYTSANGLSDNSVNDIYEAPNGKLYVAMNTGVVDVIENDLTISKAVFKNLVINRFFCPGNGRVFAVTDTSGIWEFKAGQFVKPKQQYPNASYSRMISFNDPLFVVSSPELPFRILNYSYQALAETKLASTINECIFQDSRQQLWTGTSAGLRLATFLKGQRSELKFIFSPPPLKRSLFALKTPTDIIEEADGNLWIGTSTNLINLKPTGTYVTYSESDGLPSRNISCLFIDREKNIWIGTNLGLVKLVRKNNIQVYGIENGLSNNNISKLLSGKEERAIFSVTSSQTQQLQQIQQFNLLNSAFVETDRFPNLTKYLKFGIPFWLSNANVEGYTSKVIHLISSLSKVEKHFFCLSSYHDKLIIGMPNGVLILGDEGKRLEPAIPYRIQCLLTDLNGYVWIGTWENGLYRMKPGETVHDKNLVENLSQFLPGKNIRALFEDHYGNIWVGTRYNGAIRLNRKENSWETISFNQKSGLMSNFIRSINEDTDGNFWLGSWLGLDKLVQKNNGYRVFNFSRINNFFRTINDIICMPDNEIWCGTTEGIVHFKDEKTEKMGPPPVSISTVFLSGRRYAVNSISRPKLKYNENLANFEFTAAGFINEKQIQYSYRLLGGTDTNWSMPANVHAVSYASLQPGHYNFQVRTIGWNGERGEAVAFNFVVLPPFWRTWWFLACVAIVIFLLLYGVYRYRIGQLLKMQKVRNRLATDLHDDIGSTLTNISILSELGKKNLQQPAQAIQFLQRITEEVSTSGQALDDIIWSVNSRNDSMAETLARMRRYTAELFESSQIECHIALEEVVVGKKFLMEQRRDVYLIYKESLNNIYKHASAKNVWVTARMRHQIFELEIRDDGKGFVIGQPTYRNGLKNLRWRVEKWKGRINIISEEGKGTLISISMPFRG